MPAFIKIAVVVKSGPMVTKPFLKHRENEVKIWKKLPYY